MGSIGIAGIGFSFAGLFIQVGKDAHEKGNTALFFLWAAWAGAILWYIWLG